MLFVDIEQIQKKPSRDERRMDDADDERFSFIQQCMRTKLPHKHTYTNTTPIPSYCITGIDNNDSDDHEATAVATVAPSSSSSRHIKFHTSGHQLKKLSTIIHPHHTQTKEQCRIEALAALSQLKKNQTRIPQVARPKCRSRVARTPSRARKTVCGIQHFSNHSQSHS